MKKYIVNYHVSDNFVEKISVDIDGNIYSFDTDYNPFNRCKRTFEEVDYNNTKTVFLDVLKDENIKNIVLVFPDEEVHI